MEIPDQRKVTLSESPSVHLCSKCGWPYPKPHPSSKVRRSHNKICGTIEGYKLIDSNLGVSDNERGSDEDPKTPSPKLDKRTSEEMIGGVGARSNRSEDEVFSDAVTEFSDSWYSPVHENTLKGAIVSDKKVKSLVECDSGTNQQSQVVVSTGNLPLPNFPTDSSQAREAVASETESKSLSNAVPTEGIVSNGNSGLVDSSNNTTEERSLGIGDVDSSAGSPKEEGIKNVLEQETQTSTVFLEQQTSVKQTEENGRDEVSSDVVVTPGKTSSEVFKLSSVGLEADSETSVNVTNDQIVEFKKDHNREDSEQRKDSGYTDQTEADSPQTEGEKDENVHVLSVVDDIPVVDEAETMIEGFKDRTSVKSDFPVTLNISEAIEDLGNANKDTTGNDNSFSFRPRNSDESIPVSSTGLPISEGVLEQNGGSTVSVTEVLTEVAADTSDLNTSNGDLRVSYAEVTPQTTSEESKPESCKKDRATEEGDAGGREGLKEAKEVVTESSSEHSKNDGLELSDATGTGTIPGTVSNGTHVSAQVCEPDVTSDYGLTSIKKDLQESTTPFQEGTNGDSQESVKESSVSSTNGVLAESAATLSECPGSNHNVGAEVSQQTIETSQEPILVEADSARRQSSADVDNGHCTDDIVGASGIGVKQEQDGRDENLTNQPIKAPVLDTYVDSSSQSDSLECNWGSISAFSTQSDVQGATDTETRRPTISQVPLQPEKTNSAKTEASWKEDHRTSAETDAAAFEAPSFMTLVEPENRIVDPEAPSDAQNAQQKELKEYQAAWFPSITNVANDSQGRKKNEEIIAKVTNWSTGANQPQHHTPLKSLLVEANPEKTRPKSPKKEENPRKENDAPVLTVNSILGREAGTDEDAKREKIGKEWNSPARYPSEIKKEKKKSKGRPYWVPFVCCSSVN